MRAKKLFSFIQNDPAYIKDSPIFYQQYITLPATFKKKICETK